MRNSRDYLMSMYFDCGLKKGETTLLEASYCRTFFISFYIYNSFFAIISSINVL